MPAVDTARHVLTWAVRPDGPPPAGDLADADRIAESSSVLEPLVRDLVHVTAGRMGWPLTARSGAAGLDTAVLAAAIGAKDAYQSGDGQPAIAELLASSLLASNLPDAELLARHAVVEPALPHMEPRTADAFRLASPLTPILERPAEGGYERPTLQVAVKLLNQKDTRRVLVRWLARPETRPSVLKWRATMLGVLRTQGAAGRKFVLDVYEAAVAFHREQWDAATRDAAQILDAGDPDLDDLRLVPAMRTANWWGPLAALDTAYRNEIRTHPELDPAVYGPGIELFKRVGNPT